ncbi:hypothetical protein Taro_027652 [Colocasia esculenta]|uniref:Uncharacterized protein n=1 Tax=Colocasia esculenta TaxID=4460 RepID=A0A843VIN9_COLES|nr:hypothetical protein [Colocasia esculenta]
MGLPAASGSGAPPHPRDWFSNLGSLMQAFGVLELESALRSKFSLSVSNLVSMLPFEDTWVTREELQQIDSDLLERHQSIQDPYLTGLSSS